MSPVDGWQRATEVNDLGRRIHVIGNSCSGKSTLAARLSGQLGLPVVELDALNWQPNWQGLNQHDPDELDRRILAATAGAGWIVAGSYTMHSQRCFWDRLDTLIWLDLPLRTLVARLLLRSWQRWRGQELLWGTNRESFWGQLAVWRGEDSLLWWIVTQYQRKRRNMAGVARDERWRQLQLVRIASAAEAETMCRLVRSA